MRRATCPFCGARADEIISIHALREEGDELREIAVEEGNGISIHALREEGDTKDSERFGSEKISIHALREEGDSWAERVLTIWGIFLSTPSVRRATHGLRYTNTHTMHFYPRPP